jgi:hypothetical protein
MRLNIIMANIDIIYAFEYNYINLIVFIFICI